MSEIRRRKQKGKLGEAISKTRENKNFDGQVKQDAYSEKCKIVLFYLNIFSGTCFALYIGYRYAGYMKQLHENDMWFSNIEARLLFWILITLFICVRATF